MSIQRKDAPRESTIAEAIVEGIQSLPQPSHAIRKHGSVYGHAGEPDIFACVDGRSVMIEVKRPGGYSTPQQRARQEKWRQAGAFVMVATSWEEVLDALKQERIVNSD